MIPSGHMEKSTGCTAGLLLMAAPELPPGASARAGQCTGWRVAGANVRHERSRSVGCERGRSPARDRSSVRHLPSERVRAHGFVRLRLGAATCEEMFARLLRLLVRHDPGGVLRLGRSRERLAKVRPNELAAHAQFVRELLGANGATCHDAPSVRRSFIRSPYVQSSSDRSNACNDFVRIAIERSSAHIRTRERVHLTTPPAPTRGRNAKIFPHAR